jgi:WD40 repeat protein
MPDSISETMPTPIAATWSAFQAETQPFRQLNLLIDVYEVTLKFTSIVSVQSFYAGRLESGVPSTDQEIRTDINRASAGHWAKFLRLSTEALGKQPKASVIPELAAFSLEWAAQKLGPLRNDYRGHGSTPSDAKAAGLVREFRPILEKLLASCAFFSRYPLLYITGQNEDGTFGVLHLMGSSPDLSKEQIAKYSDLPVGHLIALNPASGKFIDLYPLLVFDRASSADRRLLFFNSLGSNSAGFLEYGGDHEYFEPPHPLVADFKKIFPRYVAPTAGTEIQPNWFTEFIDVSTEHFVGRQTQLDQLNLFSAGGSKRALVVVGPPGQGKTALLAQWAKKEVSARHFIREGDPATEEPAAIFENIGLQLAKTYSLEWKRPPSTNVADYRAEFERILTEVSAKSNAPIVIQLDGLDEAERTARASKPGKAAKTILDWLPDPTLLPSNIRWIFSIRPELLDDPDFAAKFGTDKAEHLVLPKMTAGDVRSLLHKVCRWQEVFNAAKQVEKIVERSEGSPLYLRMLIEDLANRRITLGQVDQLPSGIEGYFKRVLHAIEREGQSAETPDTAALLKGKIELLQRLREEKRISPSDFTEFCKKEKEAAEGAAGGKSLELLALFAAAKEPLLIPDAAAMIQKPSDEIDRCFRVIRTVLEEQREDQFTIFHSAFRAFFARERGDYLQQAERRIAYWCADFRKHNRPYALRNYVRHLCDGVSEGSKQALVSLEATLTDFDFIDAKVHNGMISGLLRDYDRALSIWPGFEPYDPITEVVSESVPAWISDCTAAIIAGRSDEHTDKGSGLSVIKLLKMRQEGPFVPEYGILFKHKKEPESKPDNLKIVEQNNVPGVFERSTPCDEVIECMRHVVRESAVEGDHLNETPFRRVQQFASFVRTHSHVFQIPGVDIVTLAYNQARDGIVAEKAMTECAAKKQLWLKREARPALPFTRPLLVQTFPTASHITITSDFKKLITGTIGSDWATLVVSDSLTGDVFHHAHTKLPECNGNLQTDLVVSGDGTTAIMGNSVWDLKKGLLKRTIPDDVLAAALSADGRLAVTRKRERDLSLWDLHTGELCRKIECRDAEVHGLAMSADGRVVAVACHWEMMQLADTTTGSTLATIFEGHHVLSVALTPDAQFVAFGGRTQNVKVIYVPEIACIREFQHEADVTAVALSTDGKVLVSADAGGNIRVWDVTTGTMLRDIEAHERIHSIVLSADASLAFAARKIWNLKAGQEHKPIRQDKHPISGIFFPNINYVLTGSTKGEVEAWHPSDTASWHRSHISVLPDETEGRGKAVIALQFFQSEQLAIAVRENGRVHAVNLETGHIRSVIAETFLQKLAESEMPAVQKCVNAIKFEGMKPELRSMFEGQQPKREYLVKDAAFGPDGNLFVTAVDGESLRVWRVATGECVAILPVHMHQRFSEGEVVAVRFSASGSHVIFITADLGLHIWNFTTGEHKRLAAEDTTDFCQCIAVSPRNSLALRFSDQRMVLELWDTKSATLRQKWKPPARSIECMALAPNDQTLVCVASEYGETVRILTFDLITGKSDAVYPLPHKVSAMSDITDSGHFVCSMANGDFCLMQLQNLQPKV